MPQPWERRRVVYRRPVGQVVTRQVDEAPEDYARRREEDERRLRDADRAAYERGRADARHSRRSHPILTFVVLALAALGLVFVGLWARSGSPSQAGAQIGTAASVAADRTQDAAARATDQGRQALDQAGDRFERARENARAGGTTAASGAAPATPTTAQDAAGSPSTTTTTSTSSTTTRQ